MLKLLSYENLRLAMRAAYAVKDLAREKFPGFVISRETAALYVTAELGVGRWYLFDDRNKSQWELECTIKAYDHARARLEDSLKSFFRRSSGYFGRNLRQIRHRTPDLVRAKTGVHKQIGQISILSLGEFDLKAAGTLYYETYTSVEAFNAECNKWIEGHSLNRIQAQERGWKSLA
jgi:hypothetical protein